MAQFTPTSCYSLSTHSIVFSQTGVEIILNSTNTKVDGALFSNGIDYKVINGDFCFGTITFNGFFKVDISLTDPKAGVQFDNAAISYMVGSEELGNPGITTHYYKVADCALRLRRSGSILTIKCPCSGPPCTNACYTKKN